MEKFVSWRDKNQFAQRRRGTQRENWFLDKIFPNNEPSNSLRALRPGVTKSFHIECGVLKEDRHNGEVILRIKAGRDQCYIWFSELSAPVSFSGFEQNNFRRAAAFIVW